MFSSLLMWKLQSNVFGGTWFDSLCIRLGLEMSDITPYSAYFFWAHFICSLHFPPYRIYSYDLATSHGFWNTSSSQVHWKSHSLLGLSYCLCVLRCLSYWLCNRCPSTDRCMDRRNHSCADLLWASHWPAKSLYGSSRMDRQGSQPYLEGQCFWNFCMTLDIFIL